MIVVISKFGFCWSLLPLLSLPHDILFLIRIRQENCFLCESLLRFHWNPSQLPILDETMAHTHLGTRFSLVVLHGHELCTFSPLPSPVSELHQQQEAGLNSPFCPLPLLCLVGSRHRSL